MRFMLHFVLQRQGYATFMAGWNSDANLVTVSIWPIGCLSIGCYFAWLRFRVLVFWFSAWNDDGGDSYWKLLGVEIQENSIPANVVSSFRASHAWFGGYLNASFVSFYFCCLAPHFNYVRAQIAVNPLGGTCLYQLACNVGGGPPSFFVSMVIY